MSVYECIHSRRGLEVPTAFEPDAEFRLRMRQGQTRKLGTEHVRRYVSSVCSGLGFGLFGYAFRILVRGPGGDDTSFFAVCLGSMFSLPTGF